MNKLYSSNASDTWLSSKKKDQLLRFLSSPPRTLCSRSHLSIPLDMALGCSKPMTNIASAHFDICHISFVLFVLFFFYHYLATIFYYYLCFHYIEFPIMWKRICVVIIVKKLLIRLRSTRFQYNSILHLHYYFFL